MRYNNRARVITRTYDVVDADNDYEETVSDLLPVRITGVNTQMSMQLFGKLDSTALAIHFKGDLYDIQGVVVDGVKRKPQAVFKTRQNTVVIVSGV